MWQMSRMAGICMPCVYVSFLAAPNLHLKEILAESYTPKYMVVRVGLLYSRILKLLLEIFLKGLSRYVFLNVYTF